MTWREVPEDERTRKHRALIEADEVLGPDHEFTESSTIKAIEAAVREERQRVAADVHELADEIEDAAPPETDGDPTFTVEQLRPHARELFGCPAQALTGAVSAGLLTDGCTIEEAREAVEQYLRTPVTGG